MKSVIGVGIWIYIFLGITLSPSSMAQSKVFKARPAEIVSECDLKELGIDKMFKVKEVSGAVLSAEVISGCLNFASGGDTDNPTKDMKPNGVIVLEGPDNKKISVPVLVEQRPVEVLSHEEGPANSHAQGKIEGLAPGNFLTSSTQKLKFSLVEPKGPFDDLSSSKCVIQCQHPSGRYTFDKFNYNQKEASFELEGPALKQLYTDMPLGSCTMNASFLSSDGMKSENFEALIVKAIMTIKGRVVGPDGKSTSELAGKFLHVKNPGPYNALAAHQVIKIQNDGTFETGPLPTLPHETYLISLVDLKNPNSVTAVAAPDWNKKTDYVLRVELGVRGGVSKSYVEK